MFKVNCIDEGKVGVAASYQNKDSAEITKDKLSAKFGDVSMIGESTYPKYFVTDPLGEVISTSFSPELPLNEKFNRVEILREFRQFFHLKGGLPHIEKSFGFLTFIGEETPQPLITMPYKELKALHKKYTNYFKYPSPTSKGLNMPKNAKV